MRHYLVEGKTLPEAYHKALVTLQENGPVVPCPDYNTNMKEISLTFYVEDAIAEPFISRLFPGGHYELQQYTMEIVDGILDFKIGDGNCWEYTYHKRFAYQLDWIYEELRRNPYTRRAVMNIRDFDVDTSNEHPACLQSMQFFIRDGKLHMKVMMRSNDAVQATFMNAVGFIALQRKIAKDLNLPVGSYTHTAHSFHAYERSFPVLEKYVEDIQSKPFGDVTFEYEGFYKDLMQEAIPQIMKTVDTLKKEMGIKE
jgi:thymidylate synthase